MKMKLKWACIVTGILLLLGIPNGWSYGYYIFLRWVVFISSIFLAYGFYNSKINAWALVFSAIAFLFNPIAPIYMNKSNWVGIDFVASILFFLAAYAVNRPKKS